MKANTIESALYKAQMVAPYYWRGFAALRPVKLPDEVIQTFGIDRFWRLYYSDLSLEIFQRNLPAIMIHELSHLLREHADRRELRNPEKWNIACDTEINDDIEDLPECAHLPSKFNLPDGWTAERYYPKIPDQNQEGGGTPGEGSGVGARENWELPEPGNKTEGVMPGEAERLIDQVAADVVSNNKQHPGTIPGGIVVWADARAVGRLPRLSWQRAVARRISEIESGRCDYDYRRISRRQEGNVIFPSTIRSKIVVGVVVDTSASMDALGDRVAGAVRSVVKMGHKTILLDCDAAVHQVRTIRSWKACRASVGGGGTDMRIGIDAAVKKGCDLVVVLTDGFTPWPEIVPKNVIRLIAEKNGWSHAD